MLASVALATLGCSTLAWRVPQAEEVESLHLPAGARVLHVFDGADGDHLGVGVAGIGDVDGDGVGDLALGGMTGAYTVLFGPGYVRVVSGSTGATLYRVEGTDGRTENPGDAFGDTIVALGDLNSDGAGEFAVYAWRYEDCRGYVAVYSGCDGTPLATIYLPTYKHYENDPPEISLGEGPRPPVERVGDCPSLSGPLQALGDVDGDRTPDLCVNRFLVSGAELRVLGRLARAPMARTGDVDGDGVGELIESPPYRSDRAPLVIFRTVAGQEVGKIARPESVPEDMRETAIGDVDGDGFVDLLIQTGAEERQVQVLSERDATPLLAWEIEHPELDEIQHIRGLGDLDGDGSGEIWVALRLLELRSCVRVHSGSDGQVLCELSSDNWTFGTRVANVGDLDGDGRPELLVGEYESQVAANCAGRAYAISLEL